MERNEGREETQLEQDAKEYLLKQGTHDRPDITGHDFKQGWQCGYNYLRDQLSKEREMRKELVEELQLILNVFRDDMLKVDVKHYESLIAKATELDKK